MIKDEDIICISSIDWDFIWQGHQEIMTRLARNGNRVLFIENTGVRGPKLSDIGRIRNRIENWRKGHHGIRKIESGLYVYSPLVLPFPYLKIARIINKRLIFSVLFKWLKTVGFSEPIVWIFLPTGLSFDLINKIEPKISIYYCIDSFRASSRDARKIKHAERLVLEKADIVFVTSQELFKYCAQYNSNIHYFPFGVSTENFSVALNRANGTPEDIKRIKRPIAGYVGGIHKWIDYDLVRYAALKNPDVSFVFCGPIQADITKLKDLANIYFLGQKKPEELPMYIKEFNVAIIPYSITEYTANVYPTKLNEYLSMGKRVVSTNLPEVQKFNRENNDIVWISGSEHGFSENVKKIIDNPAAAAESAMAIKTAEKNSWSNKIEAMSSLIEQEVIEKSIQRESMWRSNLNRLYKKTKKSIVFISVVSILVYLAFFHTPLIWIIAEPLKIQDAPRNADVIVALGGGVGESGRGGQTHQERVDVAVKLYNQHFAHTILCSSGDKYIMEEAKVMKAISVAMGVSSGDILVDDTPVNTYEMIRHLQSLAKKNGWENIIIISSPYHMLRLKLLCDKHLNGLRVLYVPVEMDSYYGGGSKVRLKHISGIFKEYLAIMYYRIKKYI